MQIDSGVLVSSRCFDNYYMQTLTDSQWRTLVSLGAYIGEYGPVVNTEHAAFKLRVGLSFLENMIKTLVDMGALADCEDDGFDLNPAVSDVIEILR